MEKLLLNAAEVAELLNVGRSKVFDLMRLGLLRSVMIGGSRRVTRAALLEYIESLENAA